MQKGAHLRSYETHQPFAPENDLNWDDVKLFLVVAETRSIRTAAQRTRHSPKAIRLRIEAFEKQLGATLFNRSARGVELTSVGETVRESAATMLHGARHLTSAYAHASKTIRTVKVGCTEGLGAFWLLPRLLELSETFPGIRVRLNCETAAQDVASLAVDVAVQLDRPTNPDLIVTRLCWLHVVLFASKRYIARYGRPAAHAELSKHRVVEIAAPQIKSEALELDKFDRDPKEFVPISLNTASAQLIAATRGAGVTALPTYTETLTHGLEHVAPDWVLKRDVWLVCHPYVAEQPHVRKTMDWIKRSFDPARYPWFREEFIPPAEIRRFIDERELLTMFEGYTEYADLPTDADGKSAWL